MADDPRELLDRLCEGDRDALEQLLAQHLPGLRGYVRLHCGAELRERESATDLVQSVCREILEKVDRFQHPDENGFKRWLYTTALRKIQHRRRYYRAERRDAGREVTPARDRSDDVLVNCYQSFCTPSRAAMAREEVERIESAFDQLPDHYREVITQARILGLSRAEIGERMGKSEGAVRVLLSRALVHLTELLEAPGAGKDG